MCLWSVGNSTIVCKDSRIPKQSSLLVPWEDPTGTVLDLMRGPDYRPSFLINWRANRLNAGVRALRLQESGEVLGRPGSLKKPFLQF